MEKRLNKILEVLSNNAEVSIDDLCRLFSVSYASIRRDLIQLENDNLIKRKNGYVSATANVEGLSKPLGLKAMSSAQQKDMIAKYAASLIKDNQTVFMDAGSSIYAMAKYMHCKNTTVVTNNIQLGIALDEKRIKTFLLPGILDGNRYSLNSPFAKKYIDRFDFDIAFIAVTGVNRYNGYMANSENSCLVKQNVIERSRKIYFICDKSKYDKTCMTKIAPLTVGTMITDENNNYFDESDHLSIIEVLKEK